MTEFVPRAISAEMAAKGYNNAGRGELLGYIAVPALHEETCRYRVTCAGNPDNPKRETCNCRIGLWQETLPPEVMRVRRTAAPKPPPKAKRIAEFCHALSGTCVGVLNPGRAACTEESCLTTRFWMEAFRAGREQVRRASKPKAKPKRRSKGTKS